jgi:exosortase/archaeosortase family protein
VFAAALFACAVSASTWATLTQAPDLLFASAAAIVLAIGGRAMALPAVVLLLGLALPPPLEAALVWWLQRASASGAALLLRALGRDVELGGMILWIGAHQFQVIDGCSGLRGILILSLVALIVRELFASAGAREWIVVAIAPLVGHALNVVRISWVAAGTHPDDLAGFAGDPHAAGHRGARRGNGRALRARSGARARTSARCRDPPRAAPLPWRAAALALAALARSARGPPFPAPRDPPRSRSRRARGLDQRALAPDPDFVGTLPPGVRASALCEDRSDGACARSSCSRSTSCRRRIDERAVRVEARVARRRLALKSAASRARCRSGASRARQAIYGPGPSTRSAISGARATRARARVAARAARARREPWRRAPPRVLVRLVAPTPQGGPVAYDDRQARARRVRRRLPRRARGTVESAHWRIGHTTALIARDVASRGAALGRAPAGSRTLRGAATPSPRRVAPAIAERARDPARSRTDQRRELLAQLGPDAIPAIAPTSCIPARRSIRCGRSSCCSSGSSTTRRAPRTGSPRSRRSATGMLALDPAVERIAETDPKYALRYVGAGAAADARLLKRSYAAGCAPASLASRTGCAISASASSARRRSARSRARRSPETARRRRSRGTRRSPIRKTASSRTRSCA